MKRQQVMMEIEKLLPIILLARAESTSSDEGGLAGSRSLIV
jgi:hypothetical protein